MSLPTEHGENRLAQSSSAYLRSAKHQPIDWYEFGDEAFRRAEETDRLILLDIGAVWCHWCHVIDRESYENDEIAALINANYIPVKVDRDQRPDIDARYQQVVSSMTGQGGWPLTAFLTFDGRVLYGGTYFPPNAMKKLLVQLKDVYQAQKAEILKDRLDTMSLEDRQSQQEAVEAAEANTGIPDDVFERVVTSAQAAFDATNGGFGHRPKFPHFSALTFLLQLAPSASDAHIRSMIDTTLTQMALGGVYDQIGGGFHRYSVDAEWHVPHFEKMAYDNAEALSVYSAAYRQTHNPLYRETVEGTLRFLHEILCDAELGGFYATQDADIDLHDDGDYFTWTVGEIQAALSPEDSAFALQYYDVTEKGDMHERPGRNVLRIRQPLDAFAKTLGLTLEEAQSRLAGINASLRSVRVTRPTPFIDDTMYLNWNGMLLSGLLDAADRLNLADARAFAVKTLDRLLDTHVDTGADRLLHCAGVPGLLEDYAWFVQALLKGYQSTTNSAYLDSARHWTAIALQEFGDGRYGGFFDTPIPTESTLALLKFRRKPTDDTPSSSANAIMIGNLLTLSLLTEGTDSDAYRDQARRSLSLFGPAFAERGLYAAALVSVLYEDRHPPLKIEVVGMDSALIEAARLAYAPGKVLKYSPAESDRSEIRLCVGTRCLPPMTDAQALQSTIDGLVAGA